MPKIGEPNFPNTKCVPGRTIIKLEEKMEKETLNNSGEDDADEDAGDMRRSHMNAGVKEEYCKICVCSIEGKDEYCSGRPARNVNECIRMQQIMEEFKSNTPYDHTRGLPFRIRRDYIWHNDEIPYEAKAKCRRGHSYYTNNKDANDTDIDIASDLETILDYATPNICLYCVCTVDGRGVSCMSRDLWFCQYFRYIRNDDTSRDMYQKVLKQDRPTYFRQLSWRLRRTMDDGLYEFENFGGDTLCCNHPDGHRRNIHSNVRNKLYHMRRKVPKENLLSGAPGADYADFVVNNDK